MVIQFEPRVLINMFDDFVGNTKVMFNFKTDGKTMSIQMLDDYTAVRDIEVQSIDHDTKEVDISVWVTKFIHVMNRDEYVRFTINDAALFIEQNTFNCTLLREYESRREFQEIDESLLAHSFPGRLKYLTHNGIACTPLAKELSIADPDPMFTNDKFYMSYMQTAYVDSMKYPELCIPFSTLRSFVFKLDEEAKYLYIPDKNIVYYRTKDYEFWVPTTNYNINNNIVLSLDKKIAECREVTTVLFKPYVEKMNVVASAFPKQKLTFAVGTETFAVSADTNNAHIQVGYEMKDMLLSLSITSAQLSVMMKLFGDDEKVSIKKGVGCLCLNQGSKNMLIAGMIY